MPNRKLHIMMGAVAAGCFNLGNQVLKSQDKGELSIDIGDVLLASTFGAIGGALPDVFEPPIHPNHRRFCHSYFSMLGISLGTAGTNTEKCPRLYKTMIVSLGIGYISHLVADSRTPKGLPFL